MTYFVIIAQSVQRPWFAPPRPVNISSALYNGWAFRRQPDFSIQMKIGCIPDVAPSWSAHAFFPCATKYLVCGGCQSMTDLEVSHAEERTGYESYCHGLRQSEREIIGRLWWVMGKSHCGVCCTHRCQVCPKVILVITAPCFQECVRGTHASQVHGAILERATMCSG